MATRIRSRADRGGTNTGAHKALRKKLLAELARRPGQPCSRCGGPMYVSQLLDLDHTDDRRSYLGLAHRACNRRDGQAKTTAILKARGWAPTRRQRQAIAWRQRQAAAPMRTSRNW
jgi:hypothetical protein